MKRSRTRGLAEVLLSVLLHGVVLAAFGAPAALERLAPPPEPARPETSQRSGNRERPARKDAARRLERDLPRVRPETPAEQRKLVILATGSGRSDHDARATGGIPGIARPASAEGLLGKRVLLPAFEPDQLENPKTSDDGSTRRDEDRAPIQRPELDQGFGLFASVISSGRLQPEAGRPSATPAQAPARAEAAAATPRAQPSPLTPATSALPPPPGSELAASTPTAAKTAQVQQTSPAVEEPEKAGHIERPKKPEATEPEEAGRRAATSPFEQRDPRFALVVAPAKKVDPKPTKKPRRTDPKADSVEEPEPREVEEEERQAGKGVQEAPGKAEPRPEEKPVPEQQRQDRPPEEEEPPASARSEAASSGLWVAEGRSEQKREESGAREARPQPLAEGKPREQPVPLALASAPRAPGAGEEHARRARIPSEAAPEQVAALTSLEQRLAVEAFEGGEEGARHADRSARTLAAAQQKLVGSETVEDHQQGEAHAGQIVIAPDGDGSGGEVGMASVAGNADLRHVVQERVNHVASLIGPGLVKRSGQSGIAIVRFRVDAQGYVRAVKLERSSGSPELDGGIEPVLRLAEPYAGWRGWMRVAVSFGTPFLDL